MFVSRITVTVIFRNAVVLKRRFESADDFGESQFNFQVRLVDGGRTLKRLTA
jgi:hypothetical protein